MPRCREQDIPLYPVGKEIAARCVLFDPATAGEAEIINHRGHGGNQSTTV
jgi:hypothetical protein